jgi:hypothetical protein
MTRTPGAWRSTAATLNTGIVSGTPTWNPNCSPQQFTFDPEMQRAHRHFVETRREVDRKCQSKHTLTD